MITMKKLLIGSMVLGAGAFVTSLAMAKDKPESIDQHFSMMDADKDGKVSAAEHAAGAKSMFEKMDANKDGKVTADEMAAAHQEMMGHKAKKGEMSAADKIKTVDSNGDGVLTADEHVKASESMFAKMDTDKDGFLSKKEVAAGHAGMMKKPAK